MYEGTGALVQSSSSWCLVPVSVVLACRVPIPATDGRAGGMQGAPHRLAPCRRALAAWKGLQDTLGLRLWGSGCKVQGAGLLGLKNWRLLVKESSLGIQELPKTQTLWSPR